MADVKQIQANVLLIKFIEINVKHVDLKRYSVIEFLKILDLFVTCNHHTDLFARIFLLVFTNGNDERR